jgi:hypothetical protein
MVEILGEQSLAASRFGAAKNEAVPEAEQQTT